MYFVASMFVYGPVYGPVYFVASMFAYVYKGMV